MTAVIGREVAPGAAPTRRRRRRRLVAAFVTMLVLAPAVWAGATWHRQIVSYLTHWKGSPTHTEPYAPLPGNPEVRLAVAGDIGDSGSRLDATAAAMSRISVFGDPFDALLLLGDNVYPNGDPAKLPDTVFRPFAPLLDQGTQLLAILGNHDVRQGNGDAQIAALGMPGRWWSQRFGEVLIVGLDSTQPDDAQQRAWLEQTLATTDARWRIVALHHPPYSAGYQGSDKEARAAFVPIFERYGVQLVLSGHDHDYQRSVPINGVTYVVTGAASGTRRTGEADFTADSFSWHHFVELGIYPDRIVGRAVNQDARIADEFTIWQDERAVAVTNPARG